MSDRLCPLRWRGRWLGVVYQTDVLDVTPPGATHVQREPGDRHTFLQVLVPIWLGELVGWYVSRRRDR